MGQDGTTWGIPAWGKRPGGVTPHSGTPLALARPAKETNSFLLEKGQTVQPRRLVFFLVPKKMRGFEKRRSLVRESP
jgi:hypothetical protein